MSALSDVNWDINNFNPIIVLFLTPFKKNYCALSLNFNPIIVLFLTFFVNDETTFFK